MKIITNKDFLHKPCLYIENIEWNNLRLKLLVAINERKNNASGIALNQIGINKRGFVIRINNKMLFFKNPKIKLNGTIIKHSEKCFSLKKEYKVERYNEVIINDDINGSLKFTGYNAFVIQHEFNHLQGILIKDKEL